MTTVFVESALALPGLLNIAKLGECNMCGTYKLIVYMEKCEDPLSCKTLPWLF